MSYYYFASAAFIVFALLLWWRKASRRSISYLPCPPSSSWLVGNIPDIARPQQAFESNFDWTKKYGKAFRFKGCFGEDVLYLSDPKAMQHVLNTSGYNYPKTRDLRVGTRLTTGRGIVFVDGADHARHRRVMNPAFSHSALKEFVPLFVDISRKTATILMADIQRQNGREFILNVTSLLTRTTLDAIGEAALNYKFNSIDSKQPKTEVEKVYRNLFFETSYMPPDYYLVFNRLLGYVPFWMSDILTSVPLKPQRRFNHYLKVVRSAAKVLLDKAVEAHVNGKVGGKDVMSILIKANIAEDPKRQLGEEEILAQMTTLMLAGHETTANTVSWALHELSRHPDVQSKLREEVMNVLYDVASRGDSVITMSDIDSMAYMGAVMKETLRYYTIVGQVIRYAGRDDVIPLETPQRTISGDMITAIPVRQGQVINLGICTYNRLPEVWGEDADQWRPERFLDNSIPDQKVNLGVFGNLLSCMIVETKLVDSMVSPELHSAVACAAALGRWRFSVIEMQTILFNLIRYFEFRPAPGIEIKLGMNGLMQPMVKGQESKGIQLPLSVSIIPDGNRV